MISNIGEDNRRLPMRRVRSGWSLALFAVFAAAPAEAGGMGRCATVEQRPEADGRLLNHLPYPDVAVRTLVRAPAAFGAGCMVRRDMLPDLTALMSKARADGVRTLYLISCHRSVEHQSGLFCRKGPRGLTPTERAIQVAPPGFSEHATGYSIDFGDRASPRCSLEQCFAETRGGRWLEENAAAFGYEMSFPPQNLQGVSSEPWHWRWIGRDDAGAAAQTFAEARTRFPDPATDEIATAAPASAILAAYSPQSEATRTAVDPATIADDDFARNRDPALWDGLTVERVRFHDGRANWAFWRIVNQGKRDGPLWVVPHDNENAAFDASLRAVRRYGGIAVIIDTGASDSGYRARFNAVAAAPAIDPNRNFIAPQSPYVSTVLADLTSGHRLIVALHTNAPGFNPALSRCGPGTGGSGSISIRLCNAHFQPAASHSRAWPFDDDDSLAIVPLLRGGTRNETTCGTALIAADYNILFETVGVSDGSLSNYAVLHGLRYINLETRDRGSQEAGLADARERLARMIEGVMTTCGESTPAIASSDK